MKAQVCLVGRKGEKQIFRYILDLGAVIALEQTEQKSILTFYARDYVNCYVIVTDHKILLHIDKELTEQSS